MFQEKLEIEDVNIESAHRVGNTSNNSPRRVAIINIYINKDFSNVTMDIREEKWKSVKSLQSQGKYVILVYDKIAVKGSNRKKLLLLYHFVIVCYHFGRTVCLSKQELQDLHIFTEEQFEKQGFNPFCFQKVLID